MLLPGSFVLLLIHIANVNYVFNTALSMTMCKIMTCPYGCLTHPDGPICECPPGKQLLKNGTCIG